VLARITVIKHILVMNPPALANRHELSRSRIAGGNRRCRETKTAGSRCCVFASGGANTALSRLVLVAHYTIAYHWHINTLTHHNNTIRHYDTMYSK
jgi:hypothetical protein